MGRAGPGQRCDRSISCLFQSLQPRQQHEAAPRYRQPIKAPEIQAEHFCTFFHQTSCLLWEGVLTLCLSQHSCPSTQEQDEQFGGRAGEEGRSCHPHSQVRAAPGGKDKPCPEHPAQLCPAVAAPSSSSWLSPATLCSLASPSCSCPCPHRPPPITQGTIAAAANSGPGLRGPNG